jgi:hypothetical protein
MRVFAAALISLFMLIPGRAVSQTGSVHAQFVGSETCRKCHEAVYKAWKQTRIANVVCDPKIHPESVLGDFTHPDPNRPFDLSQVAFVYGSRWKQR